MNELYKQKYFKYKIKYLELSKQIGGIEPKTDDKIDKIDDEIRFQNCAIFKLRLRQNIDDATIDLIYTGEITKKLDRNYYVSPLNIEEKSTISDSLKTQLEIIQNEHKIQNTEDTNIFIENYILCTHNTRLRCFIKKYFGKTILKDDEQYYGQQNRIIFATRKCKKTSLFNTNIDKNIDIYIVRHGEGIHNTTLLGKFKNIMNITDALLTTEGQNMAIKAGKWLKTYLDKKTFINLFASKLQRTRQTLFYLLQAFQIEQNKKKFIIIPCSHELQNFIESGECDAHNEGKIVPPENRSKCICGLGDTISCKDIIKLQETKDCKENFGYENIWTYYNIFYRIGEKDRSKCRDTNFIEQIILILNNEYQKKI